MSEVSSVEALLQEIDQVPQEATKFDLWVPERLTLSGAEVASDVAMAIVLDRLLGEGFMPAGFTQGVDGRTYRYRREISN